MGIQKAKLCTGPTGFSGWFPLPSRVSLSPFHPKPPRLSASQLLWEVATNSEAMGLYWPWQKAEVFFLTQEGFGLGGFRVKVGFSPVIAAQPTS